MEVAVHQSPSAAATCVSCGASFSASSSAGAGCRGGGADPQGTDVRVGVQFYVARLIVGAISGALTGIFSLAGAFTGAVAGALAGRASQCGVFRGAGLGAFAGSVFFFEILEAFRAYWSSDGSVSRTTPSIADFIQELLHGRLMQEHHTQSTQYSWNVHVTGFSYDDFFEEVTSKGLSRESLKKLPSRKIMDNKQGDIRDKIACTICLQDIEVGDTVRSLPLCSHMFHLLCVDKWLLAHGSCPVCRSMV